MSQTSYAPNPVPRLRTKPPPVLEEDTTALLAYYTQLHPLTEDESITVASLTSPIMRRIAARLHTLLIIQSSAVFNCGYLAGVKAAQAVRR
jgi:hypothetical protein